MATGNATSSALDFALQLLGQLPGLVQAGINVADLVRAAQEMRDQDRAPTVAEWDALNARIRSLQGRLHSP